MASGGVHGLQSLLDWLVELNIIKEQERTQYIQNPPQQFFDELRNGIILGKLAVAAIPQASGNYRADLSTTAVTRYVVHML